VLAGIDPSITLNECHLRSPDFVSWCGVRCR
jgi:hypothetical protein